MRHNILTTPACLLVLAHLTTAHLKLKTPIPYGNLSLNTEPLESSGADWPCKQRPGWDEIVAWNVIPLNTPYNLTFQGQATHGGGSCQISLTRDTPPTVTSIFRVIKTFEGGCPSANIKNVGTDPFGYGADAFTFEIPKSVKEGNYTLAWTWANKIGNREFYMNCAPITVTGGSGKTRHRRHTHSHGLRHERLSKRTNDGLDTLPEVFRANSGNGCASPPSGTVLQIPDPGENTVVIPTQSEDGKLDPMTPPIGQSCPKVVSSRPKAEQEWMSAMGKPFSSVKISGQGQGQDQGQQSAAAPPVAPPSPAQASSSMPASPPAQQPATQAPATPSSSPVPSASSASPSTTSAALQSSQKQPPQANSVSVSPAAMPSIAGIMKGTCPTPGKSVCSPDGKAWGTCSENNKVIYQAIPRGTRCDEATGQLASA